MTFQTEEKVVDWLIEKDFEQNFDTVERNAHFYFIRQRLIQIRWLAIFNAGFLIPFMQITSHTASPACY
jgi:hypothetical protein